MFLKNKHLKRFSNLENSYFPPFRNVSEKRHTIRDVCVSKLAAFLDNANCIV